MTTILKNSSHRLRKVSDSGSTTKNIPLKDSITERDFRSGFSFPISKMHSTWWIEARKTIPIITERIILFWKPLFSTTKSIFNWTYIEVHCSFVAFFSLWTKLLEISVSQVTNPFMLNKYSFKTKFGSKYICWILYPLTFLKYIP